MAPLRSVSLFLFALVLDEGFELGELHAIDDVVRGGPGALGDVYAERHFAETFGAVGVGVDGEFYAGGERAVGVGIVEIETREGGVDFEGGAGFGGGLENTGEIEGEALAAEDDSARGMADYVHVTVFDCTDDAVGCFARVLLQCDVGAGDDEIEFGEDRVFEIEAAIGEDVDFTACQQRDAFHFV